MYHCIILCLNSCIASNNAKSDDILGELYYVKSCVKCFLACTFVYVMCICSELFQYNYIVLLPNIHSIRCIRVDFAEYLITSTDVGYTCKCNTHLSYYNILI